MIAEARTVTINDANGTVVKSVLDFNYVRNDMDFSSGGTVSINDIVSTLDMLSNVPSYLVSNPRLLREVCVFTGSENNPTALYNSNIFRISVGSAQILPILVKMPFTSVSIDDKVFEASRFNIKNNVDRMYALIIFTESARKDFSVEFYIFHELAELGHRNIWEAVASKQDVGNFVVKPLFYTIKSSGSSQTIDANIYFGSQTEADKVTFDGDEVETITGSLEGYTYDKRSESLLGREVRVNLQNNSPYQNAHTGLVIVNLKEISQKILNGNRHYKRFVPFKTYRANTKVSIEDINGNYKDFISLRSISCASPVCSNSWRQI